MEQTLQERFEKIRKEYKKGKRKLEKLQRKSRAKAHVQQKLREQAGLEEDLTHSRQEEAVDNTLESRNSSFELTSLQTTHQNFDRNEKSCNGLHSGLKKSILDREKVNNEIIPLHGVENEKCIQGKQEKKDQKNVTLVTNPTNVIKQNENNSASPILGESNNKVSSPGRLSLSKYKKKHLTNKLTSSPVEQHLNKLSPTIVGSSTSQRNDNGDNEKLQELSNKHCDKKTVNSGEAKTLPESPEVDKADAIIFERLQPLQESDYRNCTIDGEPNKKKNVEKNPTLVLNDRMKHFDSVNNNLSDASQDSVFDSPQVSDERNKIKLTLTLPKQKRRSLNGARRLSPRVSSSVSYLLPKVNGLSYSMPKVRSRSKPQEHIMISSMFQCLIDDVKRDNKLHDFELIGDYEKYIKPYTCQQETHNSILFSEEKENIAKNRNMINNLSDSKEGKLAGQKSDIISNCVKSLSSNEIPTLKEKETSERALEHIPIECLNNSLVNEDKTSATEPQQSDSKDAITSEVIESVVNTPSKRETVSQDVCSSPPLFESPTNCLNSGSVEVTNLEGCPIDSGDLDVLNPATKMGMEELVTNKAESDFCSPESSFETNSGVFLEQIATFEIPSGEVVLSLAMGDTGLSNNPGLYMVCLCTQSLRFYRCHESSWTCMLNYTLEAEIQMKKNSGGRIFAVWLDDSFGVVLQQPKTNFTNLHLYLYKNGSVQHSVIDGITGRSINVKCLSEGVILASYFTAPSTYVTKYTYTHTGNTQNQNLCQTWRKFSLEKVCGQVTCLMLVRNLDSALIGWTSSRKLHIWNHIEGVVLSSIDLADVCAKDVFCPSIFLEQGYLFLPVLGKKKCQEVGSVIVVNPVLSTSETLIPLQYPDHIWTGCIWASILDDKVLCARETTGQLCLWDLYDGHLVASLDHVPTSCFTTTQSLLAYVCKNILSVYNLRDMT